MDYSAGFSFEVKELEDRTGWFRGYASTTGGQPDYQGDVIVPGSFARTLTRKSDWPILWCHKHDTVLGVTRSAHEDQHGLAVEGELILSVPKAAEVRDLMRAGAVRGLSIGYMIPDGKAFQRQDGVREIHDVEVMEWSLCPLPANPRAMVTSPPKSLRDWNDVFRGMGYSRSQTDRLVHAVKDALNVGDDDELEAAQIHDLIAFMRSC